MNQEKKKYVQILRIPANSGQVAYCLYLASCIYSTALEWFIWGGRFVVICHYVTKKKHLFVFQIYANIGLRAFLYSTPGGEVCCRFFCDVSDKSIKKKLMVYGPIFSPEDFLSEEARLYQLPSATADWFVCRPPPTNLTAGVIDELTDSSRAGDDRWTGRSISPANRLTSAMTQEAINTD